MSLPAPAPAPAIDTPALPPPMATAMPAAMVSVTNTLDEAVTLIAPVVAKADTRSVVVCTVARNIGCCAGVDGVDCSGNRDREGDCVTATEGRRDTRRTRGHVNLEDAFVARTVMVPAFKPSLWLWSAHTPRSNWQWCYRYLRRHPNLRSSHRLWHSRPQNLPPQWHRCPWSNLRLRWKLPLESISEFITAACTSPMPRPSWSTPM